MNESSQDSQLDALFALARQQRPNTSALEYAFETRLTARLREARSTSSVWAMASWRLAPIFAVGLLALTLWYSYLTTETNEAEQLAYVQSAEPFDSGTNLD